MSKDNKGIFVSLDVYSGKQDPYWKLTDEQVEELKAKLIDLPECEMIKSMEHVYHGFRIYNRSKIPQIPQRLEVYEDVVSYKQKRKVRYFTDIHNLEEWLFDLALEQGFEEAVNNIREHKKT